MLITLSLLFSPVNSSPILQMKKLNSESLSCATDKVPASQLHNWGSEQDLLAPKPRAISGIPLLLLEVLRWNQGSQSLCRVEGEVPALWTN